MDAALREICANGPDNLNLTAVAKQAGVTTGSIYARFENSNELVLAAWNTRCAEPMRKLVALVVEMTHGNEVSTTEVSHVLKSRPAAIDAGIAVLISAPRIDELDETMLPDFGGWLRALRQDGTLSNDTLVPLAYVLGSACFDAAMEAPVHDWVTPLQWIVVCDQLTVADDPVPGRAHEGKPPIEFVVSSGNAVRDALLTGAVSVIGRSGVRRSTTSRIARASGHSQSTLFQTWKTRHELISDVAGFISDSLAVAARPFGMAAMSGDADIAAEGIKRLLAPASHVQRRVRLEIVLAAMFDSGVAARTHAADRAAEKALRQISPQSVLLVDSIRAVVLGLILLEEVMGDLSSVNFTPLIKPFLKRTLP